jgi:hypothetical protein
MGKAVTDSGSVLSCYASTLEEVATVPSFWQSALKMKDNRTDAVSW